MSIDEFLNRKYKFLRSDEYYDDYLKEIGLNFITRKVAKAMPSTIELKKISENEYVLVTTIPVKTWEQKFIPGEEKTQNTMDGRKIRNIFEIDANTLIEHQIEVNRSVKIVREFHEHEVKGETEFRGLKSKHWCSYEN